MVDQNDSTSAFVAAGGDSAHRAEQASSTEAVAEEPRRVLRAAVGVHDGAGLRAALPAGHLEGVDDQLGADVVRRPINIDQPTTRRE